MKPVAKWKMAILIWLGIYPIITSLLYFVAPLTISWPLPLRTLLLTLVAVPLMVFLMLPLLQKLLRKWLSN